MHTPFWTDGDQALRKSDLRRHYASRRATIDPADRVRWERAIRERLTTLPAWKDAPVITGYVAMRGEIDLSPLWQAAVAEGKTYALPISLARNDRGELCFRATPGYTPDRLVRGLYDIAEPPQTGIPGSDDFPTLSPRDLDGALMIVPGLCFDDHGYRLGYGGGYYDRYLAHLRASGVSVTTVGLTFSVCHMTLPHTLPRESHDCAVDLILDERSVTDTHAYRSHR